MPDHFSIHHINSTDLVPCHRNLVATDVRTRTNVLLFCRAYYDYHGMSLISDWSLQVVDADGLVWTYNRDVNINGGLDLNQG